MLKSGELDAIILAAAGELKEMSDWQWSPVAALTQAYLQQVCLELGHVLC